MKKNVVLLLLLTAFLAASVVPAFAQARGAFSILCNVTGARVYLNGELAGYTKPTFSALLKPGTYRVRITMEKYQPFETVINMSSGPLNLPVNLVPEGGVIQRPGRFNLTVSSNVAGAQVFVNNALVGTAPLSMQVARGNYSVRVSSPGYQDYLAAVNVAGPTAVNAVLQGNLFQLAVSSNVAGAQVYVNNALIGTAPFVGTFAPGSYAVRVSAPGYADASTVVNLNRNETVTLTLQGRLVQLAVNCNVAGAQIYVNNALTGRAPFIGAFPPGSYAVRASAPGYTDASAVVHLNYRNETVSLVLQSTLVSVQIVIPPDFVDRRRGDSKDKERDQIRLFVDGQPYNDLSFSVPAGRHNLRLAIGGISLSTDFDFDSGRNYVLEPSFSWIERQ
jgi:hypothetical protein